jgi:uroporphyrinogen decarboxylase
MTITPRENLCSMLDGGTPSWSPFSLDIGAIPGFTEPVLRRFREVTGSVDPAEYFGGDWRVFSLPCRFGGADPAALHGEVAPGTWFDEWGIGHWAGGLEGTLERHYPPLATADRVAQVESLPSPTIDTPIDPAAQRRFHEAGYPVFGYAGSLYEWSWWLRGMEQFLMDLLVEPALAEAVLRKVEAHTTRLALATAEAGVDVLCFYDDAGMQCGMQLAPELWRRFVKPAWQRVLDAVRTRFPDARFFFHCCGKVDAIVADIVELGFHVLHPIQPECMDFATIYQQFGARIALAATISAQRMFPFGSPEDVRQEVRRLAAIVAAHRRAIFMPSNRLQPETPWVNIVAFATACRQLRESGELESPGRSTPAED